MKRNMFGLSNTHLTSMDMGELVPIHVQEVLPGDTLQMSTTALVRCAPMLAPPMHRVDCVIHHWFVPFRLIWNDWENFITGGPDGDSVPVFPTIAAPSVGGFPVGSLCDYLYKPTGVNSFETSAMSLRAYAKIWNENYRDQDLQDPLTIDLTDGVDTTTNTALQYAPWEKDYFTTSRPWTQKGPDVTIPLQLTGQAPVLGIGGPTANSTITNLTVRDSRADGNHNYGKAYQNNSGSLVTALEVQTVAGNDYPYVRADLDGVDGAEIPVNEIRLALALQRFEEARARYGSRYTEYLAYLGVKSSDARLQRPEYLGGGRQALQFSEVLGTANNEDTTLGELGGHGIAAAKSNAFRKFFEEHGIVMTLMSVKPKTIYMQGSPRMDNRRTKEDFWQRELQHIGQQEVLNKEVYAAHASPDGVFGYQNRYDEYRRTESRITGEFKTSLLDFWHFGRQFASAPALNASFVSSADVTQNPFAVDSQDTLYVMCNHKIKAKRLVAKTGNSYIY